MLVFHKKKTLLQIKKFLHGKFFYLTKINLRKFKKDGLKAVEEDRYYIDTVLVHLSGHIEQDFSVNMSG